MSYFRVRARVRVREGYFLFPSARPLVLRGAKIVVFLNGRLLTNFGCLRRWHCVFFVSLRGISVCEVVHYDACMRVSMRVCARVSHFTSVCGVCFMFAYLNVYAHVERFMRASLCLWNVYLSSFVKRHP